MVRMAGASVHASLASEIGLRIVRGDYPPGTILPNESQWAETFGVSRSAVREAIKMLMAKSLLASRPKIGSWVEPKERWNLLDRDVLSWYATAPDREVWRNRVVGYDPTRTRRTKCPRKPAPHAIVRSTRIRFR